ncbi:gliding motility-associated ABC transporter ATP-binding subunit GldA [Aureivirga sp. CE67]|uniref:gliding motility-associated ABC transporter ATP-binding subunit GldA n=1 Tax=Aureivirga sp. CE67 TaxID=1788983 RepID=UPI0018CB8D5E|nr:gliding motility-associated ABC transporter ATP-binding subunit GldA [Aureivirga sp. CE67]
MAIEVSNLTKQYGTQTALDAINFSIGKGEIVGFLGPNGAGKSTTMKIITGFVKATGGNVSVNNVSVTDDILNVQKNIGYLPEHNPLYLDMYVKEYLSFHAKIHKINKNRVSEIIKEVGLTPEAHKKINQLSKGYRQRVGLAAAMLHNPDILILDEPTTGLDPNQLIEIRDLIRNYGKNRTILFSTHIMQEVEAVCDRVIIINKGKIVLDKSMEELKKNQDQRIEVEFDYQIERKFLQDIPNLKSFDNIFDTTWEFIFDTQDDMRSEIFDFAQKNGLKILKMNTKNQNLESLFTELTN